MVYTRILFSSSCIMAVKVTPIKSFLSKWCTLLISCLCLCVRVCFVCPFAYDYINIGLWAVELLKIELFIIVIIIDI
jgi:hypothetical protein